MIGYHKRKSCSSCDSQNLHTIFDLGVVPLAGYFPNPLELGKESKYPLRLLICKNCKLVQTDSVIDPKILFEDYRYLSSVGLSGHFENVANELNNKYDIKNKDILEIGCNDGVLLEPLCKLGANAVGIDPATNVIKIAKEKGLNVHNGYFNYEDYKLFENKFDLVLSNNTFAHIIDIQSIVKGIRNVLKDGGNFIFEVHYLKNLIDGNQWDNIYHEHIYYYSITALHNMFKPYDMTIVDFEEIPIHSGSIRVTVVNKKDISPQKVLDRIELESKTICDLNYLEKYTKNVRTSIELFNSTILSLSETHKIAGYGASGRANMFCNVVGLDESKIKFIVDESPERCGRYIANTEIPIVDIDVLRDSDIDLLIIFAWNYSKMIMEKTQFRKFKYIVAFPTVQLVNSYEELKGFDSI
jgi:SAM-dependent methyltransferase